MDHDPGQTLAPSRVICLDEAVLTGVRTLLLTHLGHVGQACALVDLDDGGLRGAAVDTATGQCLIELGDNTLHSASFDRAIADHMVRTGRTPMPTSTEWARELVGMMSQARMGLGSAEATFVMGEHDVGLLRVTAADVEEALAPATVRAISVTRSLSLASPAPICAVVLMANHVVWPGLPAEMSRAFGGQVPVIPMPRSPAPVRASRHARVVAVAAVVDAAHGDAASIPVAEKVPVTEPVATHLPDPLPEPFPGPVVLPVSAVDAQAADNRRKQNRLVMVGAALIAAVIVTGGITAAVGPWREDTGRLESQRYLSVPTDSPGSTDTSAPTATTNPTATLPTTPSPTPTMPPINTDAALAPIVVYTSPPPPPPPPTTRRTTPRPRQNTIPNPIPGQPPIILP